MLNHFTPLGSATPSFFQVMVGSGNPDASHFKYTLRPSVTVKKPPSLTGSLSFIRFTVALTEKIKLKRSILFNLHVSCLPTEKRTSTNSSPGGMSVHLLLLTNYYSLITSEYVPHGESCVEPTLTCEIDKTYL